MAQPSLGWWESGPRCQGELHRCTYNHVAEDISTQLTLETVEFEPTSFTQRWIVKPVHLPEE
jgi:hypothetical protein